LGKRLDTPIPALRLSEWFNSDVVSVLIIGIPIAGDRLPLQSD
jgi:hypothetical protein